MNKNEYLVHLFCPWISRLPLLPFFLSLPSSSSSFFSIPFLSSFCWMTTCFLNKFKCYLEVLRKSFIFYNDSLTPSRSRPAMPSMLTKRPYWVSCRNLGFESCTAEDLEKRWGHKNLGPDIYYWGTNFSQVDSHLLWKYLKGLLGDEMINRAISWRDRGIYG